MQDRDRAAKLIHSFIIRMSFIEIGALVTDDDDPYREDDRATCIALLREMAGTIQ